MAFILTFVFSRSSFYLHPQMAEDLIETYSMFSHALVSFSIGECKISSVQWLLVRVAKIYFFLFLPTPVLAWHAFIDIISWSRNIFCCFDANTFLSLLVFMLWPDKLSYGEFYYLPSVNPVRELHKFDLAWFEVCMLPHILGIALSPVFTFSQSSNYFKATMQSC